MNTIFNNKNSIDYKAGEKISTFGLKDNGFARMKRYRESATDRIKEKESREISK